MSTHTIIPIVGTSLIPFTSLLSLSIYLSSHPSSPVHRLFHRSASIALPTTRDEALLPSSTDRDPFNIVDPLVCNDGEPVDAERFWASQWRRKLALLITFILPFAANIVLLVFTAILSAGLDEDERLRAILLPALLVPSHLVTLLIAFSSLGQSTTPTHWPSTVHLATNIFIQFLILTGLAILPSTPLPTEPIFYVIDGARTFFTQPITALTILTPLLPALHVPPLLLALSLRRGPPLYLTVSAIYPDKIVESIPADHPSLDPNHPNLTKEVQVTVVDWMLFNYATEVIYKGHNSETMDVWDLPVLIADLRALPQYLAMRKVYGRLTRRLGRREGYNLLWKLAKVNSGLLIAQTVLAVFTGVGYYAPHYLLKVFISYLENDPTRSHPAWGWTLALGLFVSNAAVFLASGVIWSISTTYLQGRFKLQLNTMLFAKTLRKKDVSATGDESNSAKAGTENGESDGKAKDEKSKDKKDEKDEAEAVNSKSQIMTLFTVDVDRVTEFIFHAFTVVDAPIEIIVATIFLFKLLGMSALFGLLTTVLCLPLNHIASKVVVTAQENLMKSRDQRTALMNEVLQGIRMLKFMAWERSFERRIITIRKSELHWQARNYQIEVAFNCIWALTPVLVTVVSFLHYTLVRGQRLTPSTAFTSIAVFAELRFALNALPETFIQALQGFVSCRRIEKYLSLSEVSPVSHHEGDIVLSSATFTWPQEESGESKLNTPKVGFSLADMNLRFPSGKLSLICGRLGSGKSLLLAGLLGEADIVAGQMSCPRSSPDAMSEFGKTVSESDWILPDLVAYVPQQAWLQNASIKDNVVFNSPWNEARYHAVLEACSLLPDLRILEDGDETEIGEKGLNLSGGQKARVSLARAVYSRAGTLYLDDVLSAVDAHTAHAIMEKCFQGPLVENRTILLVSHHTALVSPAAAYIVALENGDVKFSGTRADFVDGGLMKELDAEDKPTDGEKKEEKTVEQNVKPVLKSLVDLKDAANTSEPSSEVSSIAPTDEVVDSEAEPVKKQPRKLIEDEKRARGRIAWAVWRTYFTALGGPFWWTLFVLSLFVAMFVPVLEKGWLQYWSGSQVSSLAPHSATFYVVGYALISMSGVILSNIQYAVVYFGSIQASKKLHATMLESVLFSTLRFHDTTSRGRLLNRFGKDIEGLDSSMADNFVRSLAYALDVVVTLVSITYVGGWKFVAATAVVLYIYYRVGSVYGQTSRDMRRLDSVTRSPLYSLFGESVSGVAVIRAFGASTISLRQMMKLADTNLLAFAWSWNVNRWLSARFNLLSSLLVGVTAAAILLAPGVTAAMAGFALAFASTISHDLLFVVRRFVQLEQSMVALERIKEYSELKQEAPEFVEPRPSAAWPHNGEISVENLVIRYAPDLPNVLHGITFTVAPREKIGIVGSTGCGKSTLALSFFRFVEAFDGRIVIDGIDISKIGLTDLRTRITIIPQDPTILSGTLRSTLDVFDEYDDAEIYAALRRVHLLKEVPVPVGTGTVENGAVEGEEEVRNKNVFRDLSNPVSEGGENFSSGEKQLICMARAILKRNKVLFMDEATASIDYETDELISKTIREEFSDSTIMTIAHRIHTIIDFDKVLVMDQGRIAEYASPAELLRDHNSKFYALCKATGRTEFKNLKEMAAEAERKRKLA